MSERLTLLDIFGGVLTNSEIHHFGGAHTGTEVAYSGEPIDKLFEIENMCYDKLGREVITLARLRELAALDAPLREGRVVVLPIPLGADLFRVYGLEREEVKTRWIGKFRFTPAWFEDIADRLGKDVFLTQAEAERVLSAIKQPDRCATCENNGKPICSSCIMAGHGNDVDFYRNAGKGEKSDG